jgi:hypothetical protein
MTHNYVTEIYIKEHFEIKMIMRTIIAIIVAMAIVGNVSMSSLSPSTIDFSKIDCKKVVYSGNWGLDKTLEVIRHCTGAVKEVR